MIVYIMDEDTVIDEFYVSPNGSLEPIETPSPAFGRDYSIRFVNGSPILVLRYPTVKLKGVMHETLEAVYQTREHQNALVEITD